MRQCCDGGVPLRAAPVHLADAAACSHAWITDKKEGNSTAIQWPSARNVHRYADRLSTTGNTRTRIHQPWSHALFRYSPMLWGRLQKPSGCIATFQHPSPPSLPGRPHSYLSVVTHRSTRGDTCPRVTDLTWGSPIDLFFLLVCLTMAICNNTTGAGRQERQRISCKRGKEHSFDRRCCDVRR